MKKIFIEDGLSIYNKTGIGQYTQNLVLMLTELGYKVILPRKYFLEKVQNATIKRILYVLWLNIVFPFLLIFSGAEKAVFTNYLTPLYKIPTKKYYPVIHDLWVIKFPETMSKIKRNYQKWILDVTKKNYYKIITVSETVKKEIIDYYKCSHDDICVIYNYFSFGENPKINLSDDVQENILKNFGIEKDKYILSVGSLNKRKNIQSLIDAYNQIDTDKKLVIVGKKENEKFNTNNSNIIFTGYVEDEELKVLYKYALLFVFPSIYEGFGIPLIDAQSFGIPVICSDIPIFREVGGDSVLYFDINNNNVLKSLLNRALVSNQINKNNNIADNIQKYNSANIINQINNGLIIT